MKSSQANTLEGDTHLRRKKKQTGLQKSQVEYPILNLMFRMQQHTSSEVTLSKKIMLYSEVSTQRSEIGSRKSELTSQMSEARSQNSEFRNRKSYVGSQNWELSSRKSLLSCHNLRFRMCLSSSKGHVFQELSIDTKRMFVPGHLVHESV